MFWAELKGTVLSRGECSGNSDILGVSVRGLCCVVGSVEGTV